MNKQILENMAANAFKNMQAALDKSFVAAGSTIDARQSLEADKSAALVSGKIDGKNEEIRKAQLRDALEGQYQAVAEMEHNERLAMYNLEKARIEIDTVKTMLRIAELSEV